MEMARYVRIGLAVAVAIAVAGVLIFRESSEVAMQAVAMIGLFTGLAVAMLVEDRAKKRKANGPQ